MRLCSLIELGYYRDNPLVASKSVAQVGAVLGQHRHKRLLSRSGGGWRSIVGIMVIMIVMMMMMVVVVSLTNYIENSLLN